MPLAAAVQLDLADVSAIKRQKPESTDDFTFRVVAPGGTVRLQPTSLEAYQQWQEGLMMCVAHPTPPRAVRTAARVSH